MLYDKIIESLITVKKAIKEKYGDDGQNTHGGKRYISGPVGFDRLPYEIGRIAEAIRHTTNSGGGGDGGGSSLPNTTTAGQVLKSTATSGTVQWGTVAKGDVGLGNVDNTADSDKAVASAGKFTSAVTLAGDDNPLADTVSFDGSAAVVIPVQTTAVTPVASNTQVVAGTVTLRARLKTLIDNIAYIFGTSFTAAKATALATARSLKVNLASTTGVTFDGSAAQDSIPVTGTLPIANGGTGQTTRRNVVAAMGLAANMGSTNTRYLKISMFNLTGPAPFDNTIVRVDNGGGNWFELLINVDGPSVIYLSGNVSNLVCKTMNVGILLVDMGAVYTVFGTYFGSFASNLFCELSAATADEFQAGAATPITDKRPAGVTVSSYTWS